MFLHHKSIDFSTRDLMLDNFYMKIIGVWKGAYTFYDEDIVLTRFCELEWNTVFITVEINFGILL